MSDTVEYYLSKGFDKKVWSSKVDLCPDTCYIDSLPAE